MWEVFKGRHSVTLKLTGKVLITKTSLFAVTFQDGAKNLLI